ncbi:hypothetical protein H8Z72_23350 (plasmid) [Xanthomonas citri pv. citri]|uniref:hypothetical protein n=1 Tax=Xanthomonas citri TaxID=346 RepID=UPI0019316538|nr:hypothetical protein [Xanthomonas citri]QRD71671.1 hypothetical protein H8Z72_23350 [Xanthomonas citri pv. citri]
MNDKFLITAGPFAGTELETNKLVPWRYASGQPVLIDGRPRLEWGVEYLTPIFLHVFDPQFGWSTTLEMEVMPGVSLPDYQNPLVVEGKTVTNSFGGNVPSQLQVLKVVATLSNPEGKVVHRTVVLQGINNLGSADLGVKRASLQLYRAMGLPSCPQGGMLPVELDMLPQSEPATDQSESPAPVTGSTAKLQQVKCISLSRSESEGVELEDDDNPLGPLPSPAPSPAGEVETAPADSSLPQAEPQRFQAPATSVESNAHLDGRLLAQITHYAGLLGMEVPNLPDDAAAKKELARLRTLSNKRG